MPGDEIQLASCAAEAVRSTGSDWGRLLDSAVEIVLFGSRAHGVAGPHSDVDLLVVGATTPRRTSELDLVVRSPESIWTPDWLGSELAAHIAAYGMWLKGTPHWISDTATGDEAVARKSARILRLITATEKHWERLDRESRVRSLVTIRRELQRAALLQRRIPIPPTCLLDQHCGTERIDEWLGDIEAVSLEQHPAVIFDALRGEVRRSFD